MVINVFRTGRQTDRHTNHTRKYSNNHMHSMGILTVKKLCIIIQHNFFDNGKFQQN